MPYPIPYVAIIDVGHGNSSILRDNKNVIIIDCGARGAGLVEFLVKENIYEVDCVFLSHADQDHIGGLLTLLSSVKFTIHEIYVNSDSSKATKLWDDMVYELSQRSESGEFEFHVGITRDLGLLRWETFALSVIGPSRYLAAKGAGSVDRQKREITSNSISASFQVMWKDQIIAYLSGDIDQVGLDDLLDHKISLSSPILVFPHHGGNTEGYDNISFTEQLCSLTKANTVIFSIGRNKHNNPRPEVVSAVRRTVENVRIACTQLSKNCAESLPINASPHLLAVFARGKERNECCGGTFIIKLEDGIENLPDAISHQEFIDEFAPLSLCTLPLE